MSYRFIYPDIAQALYLSLCQDPFYLKIGRNDTNDPASYQEAMLRYFDFSMVEGRKYGELHLSEGGGFGASVWLKPVNDTLSEQIHHEKTKFMQQNLGKESLKLYIDIVAFMSEKSKGIVPDGSWYLSILGITPQCQNQGLGRKLVQPILDKADGLGVPSYLETFSSRNRRFYQRLGYWDSASFVEPVTGSEYWIMMREPFAGA